MEVAFHSNAALDSLVGAVRISMVIGNDTMFAKNCLFFLLPLHFGAAVGDDPLEFNSVLALENTIRYGVFMSAKNYHDDQLNQLNLAHGTETKNNGKLKTTRVSAAAEKTTRRSGSARAKYSVSHHMVTKPFLLLSIAAEYRSRRWV